MTNPVAIDERIKMLYSKVGEVLSRRLKGFEREVIKYGKDEGVIDSGEITEIWVTTVVEIRMGRKPKCVKEVEE